jgi:diaminohydroxyphosphoribosylaminopyrimidine deaminase/5-amino-6-(5-phosphoribosylamino)uracil reductase
MFSDQDRLFMRRALDLAEKGLYTTTPNPRVGAVIVKDGKIVGQGWHEMAGMPHAEIHAIKDAGLLARGATLYVTLEPCSHHGRTPPCADAVIEAGISRVVAAMQDPNPLVAGRGLKRLMDAGINVECGLLEMEAVALNPGFVSRMKHGRPWIRMKVAASLDGKTALENGESKWITGDEARQDGHRFRARACAILTGIGTVLADDPRLTVRDVETSRQPLRIVLDSRLRLPLDARILEGDLLIVAAKEDDEKRMALEKAGAEVIFLPDEKGRIDLHALLREFAGRGINELHVEAGARLNGALLNADLVDEFVFYLAPCLLGKGAKGMFDIPALQKMEDRHALEISDVKMLGKDLRILGRRHV